MKVKAKRLVSLVCALGMCAALLPATVLANEGTDTSVPGSSTAISTADGVVLDKTVTSATLDANLETGVNLSVSGTETKDKVAVLFVFDKSTSDDIRGAAKTLISELATKQNTDIKFAIVTFSGTAKVEGTGWMDFNSEDAANGDYDEYFNDTKGSGTNYQAGLMAAEELLNDSAIEEYSPYLITVTDGITYIWNDENGTAQTTWSNLNDPHSAGSSTQNSTSTWEFKYKDSKDNGSNIHGFDRFYSNGIEGFLTAAETDYQATADAGLIYPYAQKLEKGMNISIFEGNGTTILTGKTVGTATITDDGSYGEITPAAEDVNYLIAPEAAVYKSVVAFKDIMTLMESKGASNHVYSLCAPESEGNTYWDSFPFGKELMGYLCDLTPTSVDDTVYEKSVIDVTPADAAAAFEDIKDQIMYAIEDGTITDVIGNDFDVTDLDSFELKVGDTTMAKEVNKETNTVTFYDPEDAAHENAPYVLSYTPGTEDTKESFTFAINVPVENLNPLNLSYKVKLVNVGSEAKKYTVPTNEKATLTYTSTTVENPDPVDFPVPQVSYYVASIEPADITIYMGGDNGYEGVAEDNGTISGSKSLPEPGYYITLPTEINTALNVGDTPIDLSDHLTISTRGTDSAMSWSLAPYGNTYSAAYNKYIYALVSETGSPFRLNFVAGDQTYTSDTFDPETAGALYNTYTMEVYPELVNNHQVTINVTNGDQTYTCIMAADTGTLNIRYVTGDQDSVVTPSYTDIAAASQADDPTKDALDKAYVIRDADTKFYVNGSDVDVSEDKGFADVSLLFDDIISSGNTEGVIDYSAEITEKAIETAAKDFQNVQYEAKYLDLVDANNGNVWLTPSDPVTVYWPYPAGTDANTTFKLVHFVGLDRDMDLTDVENDIANAKIEVLDVKTDKYGISFTTASFSPFVLLWDNSQTTTVTSTPAPDEHPDIAEAKANGTWGQPTPTPAATTSVVPQTSDDMPVTLLIVVAVVAAAAAVVLVVARKRRRDQ